MLYYGRQSIDQDEINAVTRVLRSPYLTQGPLVAKFEKALATYCGAKYVVAVPSGTAALHLAYLAAGLKKGDEVITSPNTFAATTNMLLAVGARPVFCDIRLDTYNIDETAIEKLITRKTRAIVPVHFAGQPCEMDAIWRIAKKHKLMVIEDAAHALGASRRGKKIGSGRSIAAIFSFHPVKPITTGEGGAVLTNSKKFYAKLRLLSRHGMRKDQSGNNVMVELGYNYSFSDLQSALGLTQLKKLDRFITRRRQLTKIYEKNLKNLRAVILPKQLPHNYSGWHLYVLRTRQAKDRNALAAFLRKNGIVPNFHFPAVYQHPYYRKLGYGGVKLRNMELYQDSRLVLPLYPRLTAAQVEYVCKTIRKFYAQ